MIRNLLIILSFSLMPNPTSGECYRTEETVDTKESFIENIRLSRNATTSMNITYSVRFPSDSCCPVMHFHVSVEGSQPEPDSRKCSRPSDELIPNKQYVSLQDTYSKCSAKGSMTTCSGTQAFRYLRPRTLYVNIGYECGKEKALNLHYEFCVSDNLKRECQTLNYDLTCDKYINGSQVYFPNVFGHINQGQVLNNRRHLDVLPTILNQCYQHISSFLCKSIYPECQKPGDENAFANASSTYIVPCRKMCDDFLSGCKSELSLEGIIDCDNYPEGLPPSTPCTYLEVLCPSLPGISNGSFTLSGNKLNDIAEYFCEDGLVLVGNKKRTCLPSGQWSSEPPTCIFRESSSPNSPTLIIISCTILFAIMLSAIVIIIIFRRNPRLLRRCFRQNMVDPLTENIEAPDVRPRVFVCFSTYDRATVDLFINNLRENIPQCDYFTFQDDFPAGDLIVDCIRECVWKSTAVILFLTQEFIESEWCLREFDEAYHRTREDNHFKLITVLDIDDANQFNNVPPDMRRYLRRYLYLSRTELHFWNKLRRALCERE